MRTLAMFLATVLVAGAAHAQSAADGEKAFKESQCMTCHSMTSKKEPSHTGPALFGVTKRPGRTKEWLISWISDPDAMLKSDKLAQQLLKESNGIPMTAMLKLMNGGKMDVVKTKATAIYEYLKANDAKPDGAAGGAAKKKN